MTERPPTHVWPILIYRDAPAAITFLEDAFGFELVVAHADDDDSSVLDHVQMNWSGGGGVMFSSVRDDSMLPARTPGSDAVYVVCADPDTICARAVAAGAEVVMEPFDTDYGSRDFSAKDPEGNLWSFGTYPGA